MSQQLSRLPPAWHPAVVRATAPPDSPPASLGPTIAELERVYREVCPWFKPQRLPQPVIVVQSAGRRRAYGWFCAARWSGRGCKEIPEITICAEHLARDVFEVAETLIHEMVHWSNHLLGVRDCSSNQYHMAAFRTRAEEVGLHCRRDRHGWAETSLSDEARQRLERLGLDPAPFQLFRLGAGAGGGAGTSPASAPKPKLRRWTCGCSRVWAAAGANLTAFCTSCNQPWVRA